MKTNKDVIDENLSFNNNLALNNLDHDSNQNLIRRPN